MAHASGHQLLDMWDKKMLMFLKMNSLHQGLSEDFISLHDVDI